MNEDEQDAEPNPIQAEFLRVLESLHEAQERDDIEEVESLGMRLLLLAAEAPPPQSESMRLNGEAHEHEAAGRWDEAEVSYRAAIAAAQAENNPTMQFKYQDNLSRLHIMRGNLQEALRESQAALSAARESEISPLIILALEDLGRCYSFLDDWPAATAIAEEMLQTIPDEKMYEMQRARAHTFRARCHVQNGAADHAREDLAVAEPLLFPHAESQMLAGYQSGLAYWWEVSARVRVLEGDSAGAVEAMERSLGFARTVAMLPQLDGPGRLFGLARTLERYAEFLKANGQEEEAEQALEESRGIKRQLGL